MGIAALHLSYELFFWDRDKHERCLERSGVFLLGGVGWLATSFIGGPFRQFFDLRREVIHKSVLYANVSAAEKENSDGSIEPVEISEGEIERLREAIDAFRDLAARTRALALNEPLAVWLVKFWGYDPVEVSSRLLGVSNTMDKYGRNRSDAKEALERALQFRTIE
jgi:hypothetical protein